MNIIKYNLFVFLLSFSISFYSIEIISETVEEIIVKGDWREGLVSQEDSSVLVLGTKIIESQAIKHFENLTYLIPNLNFAASDSRARHFQIRGIGER